MAYTLYKDITTINRTVMSNKTNKYIVIHYTGNKTDTAKNNAAYFKSVNRNASAHYFVDNTTVYQVVEDKDAAWSVGVNYGSDNLFNTVKNNNSINIEMCSDNGAIADATFINTVELTKSLMEKYGIPASNVYRHFDVCSKQCPGWTGWVGSNVTLWNKFKSSISGTTATAASASTTTATASASELYRVRKTWADASSQIGAYSVLENAKAACKDGYSVFDRNGNIIYTITSSGSSGTTTASTASSASKLKVTSNIRSVQTWLNTYYDTGLSVDGIYGTKTKSALIKAWQTEVGGLAIDGAFGSACKAAASKHNIKKGDNGILVTIWQAFLVCKSYNPNGIDGNFGNGCNTATLAYQKANGLVCDGIVGSNTWYKALH